MAIGRIHRSPDNLKPGNQAGFPAGNSLPNNSGVPSMNPQIAFDLAKEVIEPTDILYPLNLVLATQSISAASIADLIPDGDRVSWMKAEIVKADEALLAYVTYSSDIYPRNYLSKYKSSLEIELISTLVEQGGLDDSKKKTEIFSLMRGGVFLASMQELNWDKNLNSKQTTNFQKAIGAFVRERSLKAMDLVREYIIDNRQLSIDKITELLIKSLALLLKNADLNETTIRSEAFKTFVDLLQITQGEYLSSLRYQDDRSEILEALKAYPIDCLNALTSARFVRLPVRFLEDTLLIDHSRRFLPELFGFIDDLIDKKNAFQYPELKKRILDLALEYCIGRHHCSTEFDNERKIQKGIGIQYMTPFGLKDLNPAITQALAQERTEEFIRKLINNPDNDPRLNNTMILLDNDQLFPDRTIVQKILNPGRFRMST